MKPRTFTATQTIPVPREKVFAFFSDPRNLEVITPPWLQFRIAGRTTEDVREGSEFTYRLKLRGIPLKWVSRITEWVPGERFVDEQIRGPYAMWHHTHTFEDAHGGTRIGDRVLHRLPLAPLSHWIAGRFVSADVRKIFEFRGRRIEEVMVDQSVFYFAYGSNADPDRFRSRVGDWRSLRPARLDGYRLRFAASVQSEGGGGAVVDEAAGEHVDGVLYEITPGQMTAMDRVELDPSRDTSGAGRRVRVSVSTERGHRAAELYTVEDDGTPRAPSELYLGFIVRGLRAAGHREAALERVRRVAREAGK